MGNHTPWQISTFFSFARARNSFQNQCICLRRTSSCFSKAAFSAVPREPELLFSKKRFATKSSLLIMTWKNSTLISQQPLQIKRCTHFVDPLRSSFRQHGSCNQGWFNDTTLPRPNDLNIWGIGHIASFCTHKLDRVVNLIRDSMRWQWSANKAWRKL